MEITTTHTSNGTWYGFSVGKTNYLLNQIELEAWHLVSKNDAVQPLSAVPRIRIFKDVAEIEKLSSHFKGLKLIVLMAQRDQGIKC